MCTPCSPHLHSSIAHLYHPPSCFSPAGPQPWSPPLLWPSAGISADASAPLRADNPSSLTLLQLSRAPHWQSSPTDVSLLICRPEQQEQPPSCDAHSCFCMHMWACPSAPRLARRTDLPLPSVSLGCLSSQLPALCLPQGQAQQQPVWSCLGNRMCSAGIPGRQEGQMMAHW